MKLGGNQNTTSELEIKNATIRLCAISQAMTILKLYENVRREYTIKIVHFWIGFLTQHWNSL